MLSWALHHSGAVETTRVRVQGHHGLACRVLVHEVGMRRVAYWRYRIRQGYDRAESRVVQPVTESNIAQAKQRKRCITGPVLRVLLARHPARNI